jgi:2-pyrone-4,6-dicarboxylate lactonase
MKNVYFLSSRRLGLAWVLAGLAAVLPLQALSQAYPTKPVKVLVGFTAGGAVDLIARSVGQVMSAGLGQPVVVENKPGAGTNIAMKALIDAPPDGYMLKDPGWLDWYTGPSKPRFQLPAGSVDAHCHVFGPGAEFPYAPERKYTPCDASKAAAVRAARPPGLRAQRDRAGHLPRRRQPRHGRCLPHSAARRVAWPPSSAASPTRTAAAARGRRARRALQLRQAPGGLHAQGRAAGDRRAHRPLGWHVVIYFEAVDLPELWDFFTALPTTVVVDHMGRPDVSKPVDGPQFALFVKFMREHTNVWSKVSCPERLSVTGPKALNGEQAPTATWCPSPPHRREFPDRVLWGTDWPHPNLKDHMPDDGLLVDFIPHIAPTPNCSASCWWTTRCACTGPRSTDHGTRQTLPRRARHDHLRRRAVAQGLLAQPVLHEPDEGREPRALQGRRARLPRRVADDRRAEAGRAGARPEPLHRAGGNIYFLAKIGATDGKSFQQMAGSMTGMTKRNTAT